MHLGQFYDYLATKQEWCNNKRNQEVLKGIEKTLSV